MIGRSQLKMETEHIIEPRSGWYFRLTEWKRTKGKKIHKRGSASRKRLAGVVLCIKEPLPLHSVLLHDAPRDDVRSGSRRKIQYY